LYTKSGQQNKGREARRGAFATRRGAARVVQAAPRYGSQGLRLLTFPLFLAAYRALSAALYFTPTR
jgi:hypothetical protein